MIKMIQINTLLFAILVVLFGSSIMAAPFEEEKSSGYNFMNEKLPEELETTNPTRYRRATCRIPIIGEWVSDSACAAGCIARGRAGGHCRNEICHCREELMLDLLRKRFNF
ncbi:PREDICTED: defensin-1-like isoform X2 [Polistes canadensis]|uniref:defensin-1-like isoform X2 n=1 Tax=Polistes canadensis TaxID=91411 RepID=UPI000718E7E0|nr:PREDICTED: defensin-1-like isoform X2 [Polistes canadensis]